MAWEPVVQFKTGDMVDTAQGKGTVQRVSETNGTARVKVGDNLFEIPVSQLKAAEQKPEAKPTKPVEYWKLKKGDRVQKHENPSTKGEVTEVTQRTVRVKWDANGKTASFAKRQAGQHLDYEQKDGEQKPEEKPETKSEDESKPTTKEQKLGDDLLDLFKIKEHLEKRVDDGVDTKLKEIKELAKKNQKLEVKVGDKVNEVEGLKHKQLEQLITYAAMRLSPLLVGMAGTGKTHAGEQVAKALGLPFYSMSVGAQTSKSDIIGYMSASGEYVTTHFRTAYEHGGVFLMDEIDAGNANVLIQINAALSNGLCAFPDMMVQRHEDFVFIASANTYGNGANRQYVGRNQLDAATLDRFAVVDWLIDDDLEESLAVGLNGKAWYMAVRAARDFVAEKNIRALISPRATQKGSRLLDVGQPLDEVIDATLLASVPDDKRGDVKQVAKTIFEKFASEVPGQLSKKVNPEVSELIR